MKRSISTLAALACLVMSSAANAQTYAIIEQDTHRITLAVVESISSPTPTTRRFSTVSISAWPELWQNSYGQIFETNGEIDCWNHRLTFRGGPSTIRDIQGNDIASSMGEDVTWPVSDGYEAFERFLCDNETSVRTTPFRNLDEVKHYYFDWLNRSVPTISASRP